MDIWPEGASAGESGLAAVFEAAGAEGAVDCTDGAAVDASGCAAVGAG
jgi:hypothetical protein